MSTKKRPKSKRSGSPTHKRPAPPPAPASTELNFDRIGRPEIDRILREQLGTSLVTVLERSSVTAVQAFIDELEAEDDAVAAVHEIEVELGIESGADELPPLKPEDELRLTQLDAEQQRQIGEVDRRMLTICRESIVSLERRAVRAEKDLLQAQRKTQQAETQAGRHERRAEERVAEAQELRGRLDKAELEIASLRESLAVAESRGEQLEHELDETPSPVPVDEAGAAAVADLEARLNEREALLVDAHAERERLEVALEEARRALVRMNREIEGAAGGGDSEEDELPEVESVLEAVQVASERCSHLVFSERAFETAADSPFWRPDMVLQDFIKLDKVAEAYLRPEGIGQPVGQFAQDLGLDWRSGVGEVWYGIHPNDYHFAYEGQTLRVAEHVRVANGSGAQRCARIYCSFHTGSDQEDDIPRGVYVGPVGRKLPDSTTG